jgi:signal transduction histidine kinase
MGDLKNFLRSRILRNTGWLRAALEAAAAFLLCFFLLLALQPSGSVWRFGLFCAALGCAAWCALRIRPTDGVWWRCILKEAGMVLAVGAVLTAVVCIPVYTLEPFGVVNLEGFRAINLGLAVFTVLTAFLYAIMRVGMGRHMLAGKPAPSRPGVSIFRKAAPLRAWLEAVTANTVLFFLLIPVLYLDRRTSETWVVLLMSVCAACAVWIAVRARLPAGAIGKILLHEVGLIAAANAVYYAAVCLPILFLGWTDKRPGMWFLFPPNEGIFFSSFIISVAFIFSRAWVWLSQLAQTVGGRGASGSESAGERQEKPWLLIFFRAGFWRAALEGMVGAFCLSLLVLNAEEIRYMDIMIVLIPGFLIPWCALRLRFSSGSWWSRLLKEIGYALGHAFLLSGAEIAAVAYIGAPSTGDVWNSLFSGFIILFIVLSILFGILRVLFSLFRFWHRLQRRSMVLTFANAILSTLIAVLALFSGLAFLLLAFTGDTPMATTVQANPFSQAFLRIMVAMVQMLAGVTAILLVMAVVFLPVAMLFSYLVARNHTKRIRELADAAGAMRGGNYSIQVPVRGEDEVARLQSDFNAMAADLGRTVRDLQTERDRVAGLLQSRRELVAGVSHELRTPVATIRAHLESARRKRSVESLAAELDILDREVLQLQSLIEDLFALSQAEVNKLTLDLAPLDAGEVALERATSMAPLAWRPGRVQVTAEIAADIPPALADRRRLEQSLTNLIFNAVRYTPPGGLVVVAVCAEPDGVRFDVRDSGEGIAPKDLPHIWERYYRGKGAAKNPGSGLGLALVKEFTEAMGGSVAVESEVGKGSCFSIRLKRA